MSRNTAATNTTSSYGWAERGFHWAIALLIVTAIVLAKLAENAGTATDSELAQTVWLYSFHKTVGVSIFFVALARIIWAFSQPRPRPMHQGWEAQLAAVVHWLLYSSLLLVPLLGWVAHAASEGFAQIWWPFVQGLPGVAKNADLSETLFALHKVFVKVLIGSLILHVVGTIKHVVLDRDQTFARMWKGTDPGPLETARGHVVPVLGAAAVWVMTLIVGLLLVPGEDAARASEYPAAETAEAEVSDGTSTADAWTVEEGTLSIMVVQLGSPVTGSFADWTADITFDPEVDAGRLNGSVTVNVDTGSLTLGSVTSQATSADFLASGEFPTAIYDATIRSEGDAYVADGTLDLRGVQVPLTLPFTLAIEGDVATMAGQVDLDRRDFGMGAGYPDESSVGFSVTLDVTLTATRKP